MGKFPNFAFTKTSNSNKLSLEKIIRTAIEEDIRDGDHTSLSCIPADAQGKGRLLIKDEGILAGVEVAKKICEIIDPKLSLDIKIEDGQPVKHGDIGFYIEGPKQSILKAERLILNIMQRMSGIATHTKKYVDHIAGTGTKLLDTRKTTPGIRLLEKMAVKIGGGHNHRMGLYDMIMLKDNHIDYAGGIAAAITRCKQYLEENKLDIKVEIEVRNAVELAQVMEVGNVDRIMLDNHTPAELRVALKTIDGKYETEASGGITFDTIKDYADTGVEYISVGALTHSIKSLDISLKAVS